MAAWAEDEVVVESAPTSAPEALSRADVATALDAGDVLDQLAGVVVRRLGPPGSRTYVSVRGSSFRQVAVHLDGIPLNPDGSAGIDLSGLPVDQVDLRLWRTFAPPAYGAPAMGAVLDAVVVDPPGERTFGAAALRAGSTGLVEASGSVLARGHGLGLLAGVTARRTDGRFRYYDDHGTRFVDADDAWAVRSNAGIGQVTSILRPSFRWRGLTVSALQAFGARREGQPGPIGAPSVAASLRSEQEVAGLNVRLRSEQAEGGVRLWGVARSERLDDPLGELSLGYTSQTDVGAHLGGSADLTGHLGPVTLGFASFVRHDQLARTTSLDQTTFPGRWVASWTPWLAVDAGRVHVEPAVDVRALVSSTSQFVALPRLLVSASPLRGFTLRFAVARAFRPPDLVELYGVRAGFRGNDALVPETGWSGELRATVTGTYGGVDLDIDAAGFVNASKNLITWIQNAQRSLVPVNLAAARVAGLEATVGARWGERLDGRVALAWQQAIQTGDSPQTGLSLPLVPSLQVDALVGVRVVRSLRVTLGGELMSGMWADSLQRQRIPTRATVDASVELRIPHGPVLRLVGRNLADQLTAQVARDPLQPAGGVARTAVVDFAGWPLPGRTFFVEVAWSALR